jgi:small-conductance mechanosensitive channel
MMSAFSAWPDWATRLAWTVGTIGLAYIVGHLIKVIAGARLTRLAEQTQWRWDDALIVVLRRLPFWSVLAGAYFSLRHWPLNVEDHVQAIKIIVALTVASMTFALASVTTKLVSSYGPRATPGVPVSALMQNVVRTVVFLLGALVILGSFDVNITPYLTAVGVGGLAVALALQDPLSNFFAGVFLSASGQIRIGDYVKLDTGSEGYVADFNWRATSIRMLSNNIVIVPNAKIAQATVTNFHQPSREVGVGVDVGVHYLSDLGKVERVTLDVAKEVLREVPGAVREFEPSVRFHTFSPTAVVCSVGLRGQEFTDQFLLKHEFVKRLHARFREEAIVMPFPVTPIDMRTLLPDEPVQKADTHG